MHILLIKTSSMGDVIHTLPALTDAAQAIAGIKFDWVVEEKFQAIPSWHPAVERVIPIGLRRWRSSNARNPLKIFSALKTLHQVLNRQSYDLVIDAQGLLKSAILTRFVNAPRAGYQAHCIRERWASYFYQYRYDVTWQQHAVERIRQLFSQALYYPQPTTMARYAVDKIQWLQTKKQSYVVLFHGTTWANKHWPEHYWKTLINLLHQHQFQVKLSWGTTQEYQRSVRLAQHSGAEILPQLNMTGLMPVIANASAVVAVDTGLCHLASALNIPTVALFGPTDPEKTGVMGEKQVNLSAHFPCAPCLTRQCAYVNFAPEWPACFTTLSPHLVMRQLLSMNIGEKE